MTVRVYITTKLYACIHVFLYSTALRVSRAAKLSALDGGGRRGRATKMASFGREGKDFEFSDLPLRVEFVACSARGKGEEEACQPDIATVREWLEKNC